MDVYVANSPDVDSVFRILHIDGMVIPKNIYAKVLDVENDLGDPRPDLEHLVNYEKKTYEIGLFNYDTGEMERKLKVQDEFFETLEQEGSIVYYTPEKLELFYWTPTPKNLRMISLDTED